MKNIQAVSINDEAYPESLKYISSPPKTIYYLGTLPSKEESCVAVVGTRHPSSYGQQAAFAISRGLAMANVTVVSGMAPGVDSFAHKTSLDEEKRTIAVLGTGLDEASIYPKENLPLARNIVQKGGCLLSELPPGTKGSKFTFPRRNRIIAGLSLGVLIVEAKEKSGSLITAKYAKKYGKKLFAVPGSIFSQNSKGPNVLIKNGAALPVESAEDILSALHLPFLKHNKIILTENKEEQLILNALRETSLPIDTIIEKTQMNAATVTANLALMEISGKIRNLGGSVYAIVS